MEEFLGKWTEIKEDVESYRQFIEKMGIMLFWFILCFYIHKLCISKMFFSLCECVCVCLYGRMPVYNVLFHCFCGLHSIISW